MKTRVLSLILFLLAISIFAQENDQTFLSLNDTGVQEFIKQHPEYDGRGTIILVLDTGVDMGIDGLTKTSTGDVKVIDVQDFTGQGDMPLVEADLSSKDGKDVFENEDKGYSVLADKSKMLKSADDNYWISVLNETHLMNSGSGAQDLNGNGSKDDKYFMVTYKTSEGYWVVYFDTNGNGDLSDEKPFRNYKENYDSFTIKNQKGLTPFTFALNIFPDEKIISLFFDDGSHGTHCAGIAAGFNIGDAALNGVAPGAKVIGLKLGNNNYPGGATITESMKKAYLYADKVSKEMKVPCIVSMSFGVGSEIEARSEIEKFLADLLSKNPYLYVSTSNGNNGPGISSAGLPSSSSYLFSSGAVLTQEIARDNYGNLLPYNMLLHFSSRGGEVSKPDVISPGAATSTVPNFSVNDKFWGTSMACPYTSGVMALLLSAAEKEFPGVKIPSQLLYKIIREGAVKRDEYTPIDQGGGYINVLNSYEILKKYLKNNEISKFETYTVSSFAPNQPDNKSRNLYIRDGSYLTGDEVFSYVVKRDNSIKSDKFYRVYNLKCDADWLTLVQKKTYIRNDQPAIVNVKMDKSKIKTPGLYTSTITAYRDDASKTPEFDMLATLVIPYEVNSSNNYKISWKDKVVNQGMIDRYFIKVPAGQNSMKISLSRDASSNKYARCKYFLSDNNGIQIHQSAVLYSVNKDEKVENYYYDVEPGIYEVDVDGFFLATDPSNYNLAVEFLSIQTVDSKVISENDKRIELVNYFNESQTYNINAEMLGYQRDYTLFVDGNSTYKMPFTIYKSEGSKEFNVTLTKEDFGKITDFAFQILDEKGKAYQKGGLSYRTDNISIDMPADKDSAKYILEIIPAFASKELSANVDVKEITYFPSPVPVDVKNNGRTSLTLYPNNIKYLDFNFSKPTSTIPANATGYGKVYFKSPSTSKTEYELPINFKF
ncbi:MAG TPA: S8 family serine peptidase [Ignavibacteriaceae bacterium]|nr:S8 family serine peptidase [Ignavibacteriaceae bacterium]